MSKTLITIILVFGTMAISTLSGSFAATQSANTTTASIQNNMRSAQNTLVGPAAYPATHVPMRLIKVSPHVYYVQGKAGSATDNNGFISNAAAIVTSQGVVVFDTLGTPSLALQLLNNIRQVTNKPIRKVIISHYHADHIYGLQVFKDLGAEVIAAAGVDQYFRPNIGPARLNERRHSLIPWVNQTTRLIAPDRIIAHETTFTLGSVRFILSPQGKNHSPTDMTLRVIPDQVLLVGDLMFEQRLPFVVGADTKQWLHTLNTLNIDRIKVVIPGHGPASMQPQNAFNATRRYLVFLRRNMQQAVNDLIPFDQAYNIDWRPFRQLPAFKEANRVNAYSVYLSLEADSITKE